MKYVMLLCLAILSGTVQAQTTFSGRLVVMPNWTHAKAVGASTITESYRSMFDWTHSTGTNANQMTTIIALQQALTNSQSVVINLRSTANSFGDSVSFDNVRFMAVVADDDNTSAISVGNAASDAFVSWSGGTNGLLSVAPGGMAVLVAPDAGYAVTTNACNLQLTNTGTNAAWCVLYVGGCE